MKKFLTLSVFILVLLILAASVFLVYNKQRTAEPTQTSNKSLLSDIFGKKVTATFLLSPQTENVRAGNNLSVDIKVRATDLVLTTVSTRIILKYNGQLPLQPKSEKVVTNPELIQAGWSYLMNQVKIDNQNKTLVIDLLLANLQPKGFKINKEISLGKLDFVAQPSSSSADFEFDNNLTKLKDKDDNSLKLNLEKAHYTIY